MKRLARSELLSTFFPTWIWQGRQWAKGKVPKYDKFYWLNAHVHPVISTYYFLSSLLSVECAFLEANERINQAFQLLCWSILAHIIFGFLGWFFLISSWGNNGVSLFGAITFTLAGYNWKQQPCYQYTVAWFPWLLYGIASNNLLLSAMSLGMVILAGYYPIGIQIGAIAVGASILWGTSLLWVPIGVIIGLPQIIPFIKYLPKTIRTNKVSSIGKVPWWHFLSLVFPRAFRTNISGVGFWEMSYYVGIVPLLLMASSESRVWLLAVVSLFLMMGIGSNYLPRIPARFSFTFQFSITWMAVNGLNNLNLSSEVLILLCLIQAFDLWTNNSPLLFNHPYSELYQKPSWAFNTKLTRFLSSAKGRISGLPYPLFTGHINNLRTLGYSGGMQLKLMSKWRKDLNPDGSGCHDFFKGDGNPDDLTRFGVEYAYTTAKCNWEPTQIKHLYRNPSFSS